MRAEVLLGLAFAFTTTPSLATPLGSVRQLATGTVSETALRLEGLRLLAHVRGASADAWVVELAPDGLHLGAAATNVGASAASSSLCDATLDAVVTLDDRNGDGLVDRAAGERARVLLSASWRAGNQWRSAIALLDLLPGAMARVAWLKDSTELPALGRLLSAPALVRAARPEEDLVVLASGWPRDPSVDAYAAGGDLLVFQAETGATMPTAFHSHASLVSGVSTVDLDADGITDRLYFADAAWQVWRLDRDGSGRETHFDAVLAGDLRPLAAPGAALIFAPDVALVGYGFDRRLDVTFGSSDAPTGRAARHWLVVLHESLQRVAEPPGPIRLQDLRRVDGLAVARGDERGLLLALPGPLSTTPLTVAGRLVIATRLRHLDHCALHVENEPLEVTTLEPVSAGDASGFPRITSFTLSAPADGRLTLAWDDSPQPRLSCRYGDLPLTACPPVRGFTRDYWVRKDAP